MQKITQVQLVNPTSIGEKVLNILNLINCDSLELKDNFIVVNINHFIPLSNCKCFVAEEVDGYKLLREIASKNHNTQHIQ